MTREYFFVIEEKKMRPFYAKNHYERLICHGVGKTLTKNTHARMSAQYFFKNDTRTINQRLSICDSTEC